ncbi:SDR family oxidoreductase [Actinosynnema sp. NPDC047251]|uniref:Glucose 1-dehydrogenase n=1 Tax=Saccharothrix espanaensis (strain ATCC 51144 / DSM 44229 / JCM 9112 / NBRC 15066 / NRRL 15764) TaxID=1179773 RepID=K0K954_SACES|nr:SDR family oxidoreductase [Saccharothrix espanaensis]CCH33369.1 Glucose 1-dehydrogenase [Saccharothrix espanaensis DSM 44229]
MDLGGTVVLVTGASGHIGAGIARRFARAGAEVVAHHHKGEVSLDGALAVRADLSSPQECARLVREAAAWRGRLDAVVNCAGVQPVRDLAAMTADEWQAVLDTNLTSAFSCTQAAVEVMRGTGGSITHIASVEGSHPAHGHAHYSAAKAGMIMFARSAALEYGRFGVRVNTVSPGLVDRPGLADDWPEGVRRWQAAAPLGRLGTPEDVGDACVFLASPMAAWITGHDLVVDGGIGARPTW